MSEHTPTEFEHYPQETELSTLYQDVSQWLVANQQLYLEEEDAKATPQTYDGLPVLRHYPSYKLSVHGLVLEELLPGVARTLAIEGDDTVEISYTAPCYQLTESDELEYSFCPPNVELHVERSAPKKHDAKETILNLDHDDDLGWRFSVERIYPDTEDDIRTPRERLLNFLFDPDVNANYDDYMTLRRIADNLSELKQAMQNGGFDIALDPTMQRAESLIHRNREARQYAVGELDEIRGQMLAELSESPMQYANVDRMTVTLTGNILGSLVREAQKPELFLTADHMKGIGYPFSQGIIRNYLYKESAARELVLTYPPNPNALLHGAARIDEIFVFHHGNYIRQLQVYDIDGTCLENLDITDEKPLEDKQYELVLALLHSKGMFIRE